MSEGHVDYGDAEADGFELIWLATSISQTVSPGGANLEDTKICLEAAFAGGIVDEWSMVTRRHAFHSLEVVERLATTADFAANDWSAMRRAAWRLASCSPEPFSGISGDRLIRAAYDCLVAELLTQLDSLRADASVKFDSIPACTAWVWSDQSAFETALLPVIKARAMALIVPIDDSGRTMVLSSKGIHALRLWRQ